MNNKKHESVAKAYSEVMKVWRSFAQQDDSLNQLEIELDIHKKILNYFQIGEFYYYIFNISTQQFVISPCVEKVLGYTPEELTDTQFALKILQPEDLVHFVNNENYVLQFFGNLPKEKVMNYKAQCDYRFKKKNGEWIRILHQGIVCGQYPDGTPSAFLGIHTDITHIKPIGKSILSFIGLNGELSFLDVKVDKPLIKYEGEMSKRERDIMNLLAKGKSYKEIGNTLFISTETVRRHLANIYQKLGVKSKIEAINAALGGNLLSL